MNKLGNYLRASRAELSKVAWPTRKETIKYTLEVIVISVAVAGFLAAIDYILNILIGFLI